MPLVPNALTCGFSGAGTYAVFGSSPNVMSGASASNSPFTALCRGASALRLSAGGKICRAQAAEHDIIVRGQHGAVLARADARPRRSTWGSEAEC